MELNKINDNLFELVDSATGNVIVQGTFDQCIDWMCMLERKNEDESYATFLTLAGI